MTLNYIHAHSEYSNIKSYDSVIKIQHMPELVASKGSNAVFITDHECLAGHFKLLEAAKPIQEKNPDFKVVLGNEIYLTRDGLNGETFEKGEKLNHLLLLAKNRKGWEMLNELSTSAWENSFVRNVLRVPTYKSKLEEVLTKDKGNIIITTACLGGPLGHLIEDFHKTKSEETKKEIFETIQWFKSLVAEDDFYLEVQPAAYKDQQIYNSWLAAFAKATNTNLVVSTDVHYPNKEDFGVHHSFLNSQEKNSGFRETEAFYRYTYYMGVEEVKDYLRQCDNFTEDVINQCINNTVEIANKCENYFPESPVYLMETSEREDGWEQWIRDNISNYSEICGKFASSPQEIDRYFVYKILTAYESKLSKNWVDAEPTLSRIDLELETFWKVSDNINERMSKYFVTMSEILHIIWQVSLVGTGRGSAGGSMICFLLDITSVNPLTILPNGQELPFWRFAHESRPELADIDWDSSSNLKDKIIQTLYEWAEGNNHMLAKVSTFGTLKSKMCLQVAARGLGYEPEEALYLSSLVPIERGFPKSISACLEEEALVKKAYKDYSDVFDMALQIEGLVVSMGQHAAAITFASRNDMYTHTSFVKQPGGAYATAYDLGDLEKYCGIIKFDMLQTKAIDSIQTTLMLLIEEGVIEWEGSLKETYDTYLHPSVIDFDTPEVWKKIEDHGVLGLFQLT